MKQDKWHGCYEGGWQGEIVAEAFAHPAKMAYGLLQRIYDHAFEQGWLKEGDVVVDPFGGIGSTGILGAYKGVQVVSCELEAKFSGLAMHNMFLHLPKWRVLGSPLPVIIQGDSRRLCELVGGADCVVGSPPFVEAVAQGENKLSNDFIAQHNKFYGKSHITRRNNICAEGYGTTPGQLGSMKAGSVEAVISSPPFGDAGDRSRSTIQDGRVKEAFKRAYDASHHGQTPGNLGNLKPDSIDAVVSSPPYEGSHVADGEAAKLAAKGLARKIPDGAKDGGIRYGQATGNLGQEQGPTFWQAAKEIVQQCQQILRPGGHAIWVVKDFVRKGEKVDFTGDWRRLCESIGFETVCVHHAMLVKERKHKTLFGHTHTEKTERKSFFRRLAEAKGSPPIDYEVVLCMEKNQQNLKISLDRPR